MSMVCPQCRQGFEQRLNCPNCSVRLQFQLAGAEPETPVAPDQGINWQQAPWARIVVGLLLAQGLAFGLQQLVTAGFLASGEQTNVWSTLWGIVILQAVQGLSLLIGGAICGAGHHRGTWYGALIGLASGLIFLGVRASAEAMPDAVLYGQLILHIAFGALGGLLGKLIWRPTPAFALPEPIQAKPQPLPSRGSSFRLFDGPVHLGRVLVGIAVVVVGVMGSKVALKFALEASQGKLALESHLQTQLITWEVAGLAILLGSGLAGACTFNGFKQGLCVGIGASLVYAGLQLGNPETVLERSLFMMLGIFSLSLAGGWFGGQLLPPIVAKKRKGILAG